MIRTSKQLKDKVINISNGRSNVAQTMIRIFVMVYINALIGISGKIDQISKYEAFTDIEFNPKKSINCQAKAAAIACGLYKAGLLSESMIDSKHFLKNVYQQDDFEEYERYEQMSIFTIAM